MLQNLNVMMQCCWSSQAGTRCGIMKWKFYRRWDSNCQQLPRKTLKFHQICFLGAVRDIAVDDLKLATLGQEQRSVTRGGTVLENEQRAFLQRHSPYHPRRICVQMGVCLCSCVSTNRQGLAAMLLSIIAAGAL